MRAAAQAGDELGARQDVSTVGAASRFIAR
jgi:hypothetical protein